MKRKIGLFAVGVTVAVVLVASVAARPVSAQGKKTVHVGGGGTAAFDQDPNLIGATTQFGIGVNINSDGSANGNFECNIPGLLALHIMPTSGSYSGGVATFSGPGIVHFAGGGTFFLPNWTVSATAGGAGVGTFCLSPDSYGNPYPACDHEVVVNGNITIN